MVKDLVKTPAGLLGDQAKLIVIAEQEVRAFHISRQFCTFKAQHLLAWVIQIFDSQFAAFSGEFHHRIGSEDYFQILFDNNTYEELFANIRSRDHLGFVDLKPYDQRLKETYAKTDIHDSMTVAHGKVDGQDLVVACMDFEFIGGSLGSVMGERIALAVDYCIAHQTPLMIICKSGGARMMESAFSLMQLAKVSGKLSQLSDAEIGRAHV